MFLEAPCWAQPDFSTWAKLFILTIDFSKHAVGAVLSLSKEKSGEQFLKELKDVNTGLLNVIIIVVRVKC